MSLGLKRLNKIKQIKGAAFDLLLKLNKDEVGRSKL
jgi:hypothetical protein